MLVSHLKIDNINYSNFIICVLSQRTSYKYIQQLNLSIFSVKSSSSSIVPCTSYMSSNMDKNISTFVMNLLESTNCGSRNAPSPQKKHSITLSRAKGSFVAKSKSIHHLQYMHQHVSTLVELLFLRRNST